MKTRVYLPIVHFRVPYDFSTQRLGHGLKERAINVRISGSAGDSPSPRPPKRLHSVAHQVSYPVGTDVKQSGRRLRMSGAIPPPRIPSLPARLLRMILGVYCTILFAYITFTGWTLHTRWRISRWGGKLGFKRVRKIAKSDINFVISASLSAWNDSAPAGMIFIKFYMSTVRKSVQKIQVSLKSYKHNG